MLQVNAETLKFAALNMDVLLLFLVLLFEEGSFSLLILKLVFQNLNVVLAGSHLVFEVGLVTLKFLLLELSLANLSL